MHRNELISLIREFSDRSIRWLLETPDNLRGLLLLIDADLAEQIDYTKVQQMNRTFILDNFRKREADLIFSAPFSEKSGKPSDEIIVYILIEHQSTIDPTMAFRVLSYMIRIWEVQRHEWEEENLPLSQWKFRPILPVVFYTGRKQWGIPLDMRDLVELPSSLARFIPRHEILFLNLKTIEPGKLVEYNHPFGWLLRVIQKEWANAEQFEKELRLAIEHLGTMSPKEQSNWEKLIYFLFAFVNHRRNQMEHEKFLDIIKTTVIEKPRREIMEEMSKTMAQIWTEQGLQQGLQQGKKEGLHEAISLGMELKFGTDGLALMEKVLSIESIEKLEVIKEAIKIAKRIEEVEKLIKL